MCAQRCADLWFSDGNIVIRAQERSSDDDKVTKSRDFRVYRGILEKFSDGILAKGNIESLIPEEKEEGCPILPFYDDPVDDVERFLKMIYCYDYDVDKDIKDDILHLAGVLRLSRKYQFPHMRNTLVAYLISCFPTTLAGFLNQKERCEGLDGFEVAVVNLARQENIPEILPTAMYSIAIHSDDSVFINGVELSDGSWARLDPLDERRCLLARAPMRRFVYECVDPAGRKHDDFYETVDRCKKNVKRIHNMVETGEVGPLHGDVLSKPPCQCDPVVVDYESVVHTEAWRLLPQWLGLVVKKQSA